MLGKVCTDVSTDFGGL